MQNKTTTNGERLAQRLFSMRPLVIALFVLITVTLGWQVTALRSDAAFEKMIPTGHPYVANYLKHREALGGLSNVVRVVVENRNGSILDAAYLETLREITDEVFYLDAVDRGNLRSLWTPNARWMSVTADGFTGGPIIPRDYDGGEQSLANVGQNIRRSREIGVTVANDLSSALVQAPLLSTTADGKSVDYAELSSKLELIREKFNSESINVRITGFAKLVGDLIEGVSVIALFFLVAVMIMAALLFIYTRSVRATLLGVGCSSVAVLWQLGLLTWLGYGLDPYSVLVPFLIFAIATSHAIQIINAVALNENAGDTPFNAAQAAFARLIAPGASALLSDSIGFLTLVVIPIAVIAELAVSAGMGVAMVLFTNLLLLPVLLSYCGVGRSAAARSRKEGRLWHWVAGFATRPRATVTVLIALLLACGAAWKAGDLKIGDLDAGAPELRPDSRYNRDVAYLSANYSTSTDVLVVMTETEPGGCVKYPTLASMDSMSWALENTSGVQGTTSIVDVAKLGSQGFNEGNLKWRALNRNQLVANATLSRAPGGLYNGDCSMAPLIVFLEDHKSRTLEAVTARVEEQALNINANGVNFALAAGNAGIEAATNEVISSAQYKILALVYIVVALLISITFRSWRALVVILLPLMLTSVMSQALMATLGMGIKVATLPVIALGVGIGVDYGIYIYDRLSYFLKQGLPLDQAYLNTVRSTGNAVAFTGLALAVGVATWILAPTKFQADMGLMLTFMFLWNMIGALTLLPALMKLLHRDSTAS